ncbi:DUF805 domain-containing protein [Aestuariibius sp. 2305UL40-4]|uniref:DUF805 domain-containing protein n=1 Tax=Aestuariibius violaceus TaxID=3234132 RepID=UPI00345E9FCD
MTPLAALQASLARWRTFSGRSRRSEFWWTMLAALCVVVLALGVDQVVFGGGTVAVDASPRFPVTGLALLAMACPLMALGWRRMQDTGRPGWLTLVPLAVVVPVNAALAAGWLQTGRNLAYIVLTVIELAALALTLLLLARPSEPGANRYGANPKGVEA